MPFDDNDIKEILARLGKVSESVVKLGGSVATLAETGKRCAKDIDEIKVNITDLFKSRLSKDDFKTFKDEIYKPKVEDIKDNAKDNTEELKEIRGKIALWTGIGIGIQAVVALALTLLKFL